MMSRQRRTHGERLSTLPGNNFVPFVIADFCEERAGRFVFERVANNGRLAADGMAILGRDCPLDLCAGFLAFTNKIRG
jgi:hypothetical protein